MTRVVHGSVAPGFEEVRDAFALNLARGNEIGAACAAYHHGQKVVDLWGGIRDRRTGAPWEEDTMVIVFSTTKGMAAIAIALAASRGLLSYDAPVAELWPEFARHGKGRVTIRELLAHQAGLCVIDVPLDAAMLGDLDAVARVIAAQRPHWPPGQRHGYHAISIGLYAGELLRRADPQRRSLGRFFREEIAQPHGIDFHIGLPGDVPDARVARLEGVQLSQLPFHLRALPLSFALAFARKRSLARRAFENPKLANAADLDTPRYRKVEMPGSNGIGHARAIARTYGMLATGGAELGISPATFRELTAPPRDPRDGRLDQVLRIDTAYSLGFSRPTSRFPFGGARAFGTPGAGGSFGYADPDTGLGFAYVTNRMGFYMNSDPRELRLREAVQRCVARSEPR